MHHSFLVCILRRDVTCAPILSLPKIIRGTSNSLGARLAMDSDEIVPEPRNVEEDLDEK